MGPSLNLYWGILRTKPDMLYLTLNPALIISGTDISRSLLLIGSLAAIMNTRLCIAFGLLALLFVDFSKERTDLERRIIAFCAVLWFVGQMWMMYQAFVLGWIPADIMGG